MSLFKNSFLMTCAVVLLNGCGYQPLYGNQQTQRGTVVQSDLSSVWIKEIKDRSGQILHNELLKLFNAKGKPDNPKYILDVNYTESKGSIGIGKDEFATRANLTISSTFKMSGPLSFQGTSQSTVSYNILTSPTGTEFAERDALERAMKAVATDIYRKVAIQVKNKSS